MTKVFQRYGAATVPVEGAVVEVGGGDIEKETITGEKLAANTITGEKLAANTVTGGKLAKAVPGRQMVLQVNGFGAEKLAATTKYALKPGGSVVAASGLKESAKIVTATEESFAYFIPVLAEYEIAGKTLSWELEATILTNAVAIGTNLTFALSAVSTFKGAEKTVAFTFGSAPGFAAFTAPAAETSLTVKKAAITLVNNTVYVPNLEPLAETAAKSDFAFSFQLFAKNE